MIPAMARQTFPTDGHVNECPLNRKHINRSLFSRYIRPSSDVQLFICAEPIVNDLSSLFWLICIRFGAWEERRLIRALLANTHSQHPAGVFPFSGEVARSTIYAGFFWNVFTDLYLITAIQKKVSGKSRLRDIFRWMEIRLYTLKTLCLNSWLT